MIRRIYFENKKIILSNRFKDENGAVPWEIKALTAEENEELQRRCMVNIPVPGQRGQYTRELDQIKYTAMLLTESVVFPASTCAKIPTAIRFILSPEFNNVFL